MKNYIKDLAYGTGQCKDLYLKGGVLWCVLWIWDYFHDKGLLFQGQGLIAHKGIDRCSFLGSYILLV